MQLSPISQATLLMTIHFGKVSNEDSKPLSISEWGIFASWLKKQKRTPADLLTLSVEDILCGWRHKKVDVTRVTQLLARGHALALAVEKWQRAGLWIMTRADTDYPIKLKVRLKAGSPPVLFGCGDRHQLNHGGLAVIGSRNASREDLCFAEQVGAKAARQEVGIVSGAARGVDEAAMLGAMTAGGNAIGVVSDRLLKSVTSKKWRRMIMDGRLTLISPFSPEAGFNVGNAMTRNKYIYCLSQGSLVIRSGMTGGTVSGAEENLKKNWVSLWVKPTIDDATANSTLVAKGGHWCTDNIDMLDIQSLCSKNDIVAVKEPAVQMEMFPSKRKTGALEKDSQKRNPNKTTTAVISDDETSIKGAEVVSATYSKIEECPFDFYQAFLKEIARRLEEVVTTDELVDDLKIHKVQINAWLKRACEDGVVKKCIRPVRYQILKRKGSENNRCDPAG